MPSVHVELGENSYPIIVEQGILSQVGELIRPKTKSDKVIVIADGFVSKQYGTLVLESLSNVGFDSRIIDVPPGEAQKSMEWFARLHDQLIAHRVDRVSTLITLGGGVVCDLGGFVAATHLRGIPYIQIPTTLLAQVDASIGGKTAVNHPKGKNLIGAFYQPKMVLIDVEILQTLPSRDMRAGLIEVIKAGVIMDAPLFDQVENNLDAILTLDATVLIDVIAKSCADKAYVVENDEKENGLREILNYGHTFGHALEALTDYDTYRHGEAVAIGMNCAAQLAVSLDMMEAADWKRQRTLLQRAKLPLQFPPDISPEKIIETMYLDKKTKRGKLRLILPTRIGEVIVRNDVVEPQIAEAISQCTKN